MEGERTYYIAHGSEVLGPFNLSDMHNWIEQGRVRAEMSLSRDGVNWASGHAYAELFPKAEGRPSPDIVRPAPPLGAPADPRHVPPVPTRKRRTPSTGAGTAHGARGRLDAEVGGVRASPGVRRRSRTAPPSSVHIVSILDFILGLLELIVGVWMLVAWRKTYLLPWRVLPWRDESFDLLLWLGPILLMLGELNIVLCFWIRSGQPAARIVAYVVAGLTLLGGASCVLTGTAHFLILLAIGLQILIIVLLAGATASAFFSGRPRSAAS